MRHRVNAASILQTLPPHLRAMVQVLNTDRASPSYMTRHAPSLPYSLCSCHDYSRVTAGPVMQSKMTPRVGMLASVPSANNGSLARILSHTSYTPPALTPDATTPLRCSACGTSNGVPAQAAAPVSPAQVSRLQRPRPRNSCLAPWHVCGRFHRLIRIWLCNTGAGGHQCAHAVSRRPAGLW